MSDQVQPPAQTPPDPKVQLKEVSSQIQQLAQTRSICEAMVETEAVKIEQVKEVKEGDPAPFVINLNGDIVKVVLNPLIGFCAQRREQLLAAKEQLLEVIEKGVLAPDAPQETEKTVN